MGSDQFGIAQGVTVVCNIWMMLNWLKHYTMKGDIWM